MARLTARDKNGEVYFPYCFRSDTCNGEDASKSCINCEFELKIQNTIAEYEDTGLTPDDIREIDRAYSEQAKELSEVKKENEKLRGKIEEVRRKCEDMVRTCTRQQSTEEE